MSNIELTTPQGITKNKALESWLYKAYLAIIEDRKDTDSSADVVFASLQLSNLTNSRLVASDSTNRLVSSDISNWIAGTTNEITATDDGDGTVTLSLPDEVYLGSAGKIGRDADNLLDFSTDNQLTFHINGATQAVIDSNGDWDYQANNLTTTGLITTGNLDVDTLNLNGNVISDSTGTISFSNEDLLTTGDIYIRSDTSRLYFGAGNDDSLYFNGTDLLLTLDGSFVITGDDFPAVDIIRTTPSTNTILSVQRMVARCDGNMADGFGAGFALAIDDNTSSETIIGYVDAIRDGGDTTGKLILSAKFNNSKTNMLCLANSGNITWGAGESGVDYTFTVNGQSNDGVYAWMEDEDYFRFSDDILMNSTERIYFNDTSSSIHDDGTDLTITTNGNLKFGTHAAITTETLSGYITIKDSAGNTRKLAVVS